MSLSLVLFTLLPVLAQAADLYTTRRGLAVGLVEKNPLLKNLVANRPGWFIALKSVIAVGAAVYTTISFNYWFPAGVIFSLATTIPTAAVVVNNVIQIRKVS